MQIEITDGNISKYKLGKRIGSGSYSVVSEKNSGNCFVSSVIKILKTQKT
jgi:hypothetical protein